MTKTAYIHAKNDGLPFDGSAFAAMEGFIALGYTPKFFTQTDLIMEKFTPTIDTPVVGGTCDTVKSAWRLMGVKAPEPIDYPTSLQRFLHRAVDEESAGLLAEHIGNDSYFVKPSRHHKLFTGKVVKSFADVFNLPNVNKDTLLWVSEAVEFVKEMRVFVLGGVILHTAIYEGDSYHVNFNAHKIGDAVLCYGESGEAPIAYCMDIGRFKVNREGLIDWEDTALVECNDAFAFGPYTLGQKDYARMLESRWQEVCEMKETGA